MQNFRPEFGMAEAPVVEDNELKRRLRLALDGARVTDADCDPAQLVTLAKKMMRARSLRPTFMSSDLFSEAGWEMLLALFCADAAGRRTTISNLCEASRCPPTTALRWLDKLIERDMVRRAKNPLDARVFFIEIQPAARSAMRSYLSQALRTFYS